MIFKQKSPLMTDVCIYFGNEMAKIGLLHTIPSKAPLQPLTALPRRG